jgi:hypothetical protein
MLRSPYPHQEQEQLRSQQYKQLLKEKERMLVFQFQQTQEIQRVKNISLNSKTDDKVGV